MHNNDKVLIEMHWHALGDNSDMANCAIDKTTFHCCQSGTFALTLAKAEFPISSEFHPLFTHKTPIPCLIKVGGNIVIPGS